MDFLFTGLADNDPNKDPCESLSDLCTMLIVAEDGLVPLEPITDTVLGALKRSPQSGDTQVMAARALALLLDKFTPSFVVFAKRKGPSSVTEGFKAVFSLVSNAAANGPRTFAKTTQAELTEELLRCLTLGTTSTPAVRAVMPATEVQLRFCQSSLDGSKWTSCKVLRHCSLLARCGMLSTAAQKLLVKRMLYQHLESLAELDVDYEWDELLRTVTEGILTLRVWSPDAEGTAPAAVAATRRGKEGTRPRDARSRGGGKRTRDGDRAANAAGREGEAAGAEAGGAPLCGGKSTEEHYVGLCLRVCANDGAAETRKELVLACTSAVLHAQDTRCKVPLPTRLRFLGVLLRLLQVSSQMTHGFSDPFAHKDRTASEKDDEDGFKALPNLQWEVPPLPWTALTLLSKLLGAEPEMEKEYVWGWRGEGDLWYWYPPKERARLTRAFFSRRKEVPFSDGEHHADLLSMTDCHRFTKMVARIHFQPVPYLHRLDSSALPRVYAAEELLGEYASEMPAVRRVLRAISFGITPSARLAKTVYLHAVCYSPPSYCEETKAAVRSVVAEWPAALLEKLAARLLKRDERWAPILCEAGVADAIAEAAPKASPNGPPRSSASDGDHALAAKRPRVEGGGAVVAGRRAGTARKAVGCDATTSPATSTKKGGVSPVVKLLRDVSAGQKSARGSPAASSTTTPQLTPKLLQLPGTTNEGFVRWLQKASFADTVAMLQSPEGPPSSPLLCAPFSDTELWELKRWLASDVAGKQRVSAALISVLLRELQAMSIEGRRHTLVDAVADDYLINVAICAPREEGGPQGAGDDGDGDTAADGSSGPRLCCPSGHRLAFHFSVNWRCDTCGQHTEYASLACRFCNYDVCHECVERSSNVLEVNPTATVGDVARAWLSRHPPAARSTAGENGSGTAAVTQAGADGCGRRPEAAGDSFFALFTADRVLPASAPSKVLAALQASRESLHCGQVFAPCVCGSSRCPLGEGGARAPTSAPPSSAASALSRSHDTALTERLAGLLAAVADVVVADVGVMRAIVEAIESHGSAIFLDGPGGLPKLLQATLTALAPQLPLLLKVDIARFLAIDCRRYALYHLQERNVLLSGAVQGEIDSTGLVHRVTVLRGSIEDTTTRLYKAFTEYLSLRNKVEYCFQGEEGTGNGPTQELYTELSRGYRELDGMWYRNGDAALVGFPSCKALYWQHFFVLGAACARAFVDGYTMDMDMLPCVWTLFSQSKGRGAGDSTSTDAAVKMAVLKALDPILARSLESLLSSSDAELDAMGLVDHDEKPLTVADVAAYVEGRVTEHLEMGLMNLHAMELGLLTSLDLSALHLLSAQELSSVLFASPLAGCASAAAGGEGAPGGRRQLFTEKDLRAVTVAAHGYSVDSKEVDTFVRIVGGEFDAELQSFFLEFLTGTARLPLNGLGGLGRKITVVRKEMDDRDKEQTLPSCNTCFLYLKLPPYTTRDVMKDRLTVAITEGRKCFALS